MSSVLQKLKKAIAGRPADDPVRQLTEVLRSNADWVASGDAEGAVLIPYVNWPPAVSAYALTAPKIARSLASDILWYSYLPGTSPDVTEIYRAFGAKPAFDWKSFEKLKAKEAPLAQRLFEGLRTKRDLLELCHDGLLIGDLVHDTFVRQCGEAEVILNDPRLLAFIQEALAIQDSFAQILSERPVRAIVMADPCYIYFGIPHRLAAIRGIPCFGLEYNPVALLPIDCAVGDKDLHLRENWPQKSRAWKRLRKRFFELPLHEQKAALRESRDFLQKRLSGTLDLRILGRGGTAFAAPSKERVLQDTPKPKILVLLHDFLDAPNVYLWSLFPDFVEWTDFLFHEAAKTDFEWYAKPHPHLDPRITAANNALLEKIKERHPKIHFISPGVSNMQLIQEGVRAMFTVHGTSSHEFAYLGIPCVNAGDNPHIEYGFNYHARAIEEYRDLIQRADALKPEIRKGDIEICCYLRFFYPYHEVRSDFSIVPEEWTGRPNQYALESGTEIYGHVAGKLRQRGKGAVDASVERALRLAKVEAPETTRV